MVYSRIDFISSRKFKPPPLRDLRQLAIFSALHFKAPRCWISSGFNPQRISIGVSHAKKTRSVFFRYWGRRNGTPYVEDANASGLGALFLCPLIIVIHLLLLLFPRSSLLCPPADLFVSYLPRTMSHCCPPCTFVPAIRESQLSSRRPGRRDD